MIKYRGAVSVYLAFWVCVNYMLEAMTRKEEGGGGLFIARCTLGLGKGDGDGRREFFGYG